MFGASNFANLTDMSFVTVQVKASVSVAGNSAVALAALFGMPYVAVAVDGVQLVVWFHIPLGPFHAYVAAALSASPYFVGSTVGPSPPARA